MLALALTSNGRGGEGFLRATAANSVNQGEPTADGAAQFQQRITGKWCLSMLPHQGHQHCMWCLEFVPHTAAKQGLCKGLDPLMLCTSGGWCCRRSAS